LCVLTLDSRAFGGQASASTRVRELSWLSSRHLLVISRALVAASVFALGASLNSSGIGIGIGIGIGTRTWIATLLGTVLATALSMA
jgi:hypothetical protein